MIRIVTDSSCDLPASLAEDRGVAVVPLTVRFGDVELIDRVELPAERFWARLADEADPPSTAAPPAGGFAEVYRRLAEEGAKGIVAVCLSSALSGTYQAARLAARQAADVIPVRVVDSRQVSYSLGFVVLEALRASEAGGGLPDVEQAAIDATTRTGLEAALDTLAYLRRGGRIGAASALVGGVLDLKPLIKVEDGSVAATGRARTRGKALDALARRIAAHSDAILEAAIVHGDAQDVDSLRARLAVWLPDLAIPIATVGPVVGSHTGPGVIGVAYRLR